LTSIAHLTERKVREANIMAPMARISLSPFFEDDSENNDTSWGTGLSFGMDANLEESFKTILSYSDDDDSDDDEESPHPLGFGNSNFGRTRFALDVDEESMEHYKRRWGFVHPFDDDEDDLSSFATSAIKTQTYPPLSSYLDPETAPTSALARYSFQTRAVHHRDDTMDRLASLLQAAALSIDTTTTLVDDDGRRNYLNSLAIAAAHDQEMQVERRRVETEHRQAAQALTQMLRSNEEKAAQILSQLELEQQKITAEQDEKEAEREKMECARKEEQKRQTAKEEKTRRKEEEKEKLAAKELEFVVKAKKLVAQLVVLRDSVAPFETSKALSKRRLGMKKIVNGKVNTLAENVDKIRSVAADVSKAIAEARVEDEQVKKQMQAGANHLTPEMARGKRFLVDLLASKVIVRVQAEGFNG
jgi:hypothetical protein